MTGSIMAENDRYLSLRAGDILEIFMYMTTNENILSEPSPTTKRVVALVYDGANATDIVGPLDVLAGVQLALRTSDQPYKIEVVSLNGGPITTGPSCVQIQTTSLSSIRGGDIDILLVPGGETAMEVAKQSKMRLAIEELAAQSTHTASICTGAFLLAEAGLLNERRATTHWAWAEKLRQKFPDVTVEDDKIYIQDGKIFTSAGITAGMDLALALVQLHFGPRIALTVAQYWVMFLKRPGGQSQFSCLLPSVQSITGPIERVMLWAQENLESSITVESMARYSSMSPRNFHRRFTREVGQTPSKYIQTLRLFRAKSELELSQKSLDEISRDAGFTNSHQFRRSFIRSFQVSPTQYRNRNRELP